MVEALYPGSSAVVLVVALVLDVLAVAQVWRTRSFDRLAKTFWSIVVVVIPFAGAVAWLLLWTIFHFVSARKSQ